MDRKYGMVLVLLLTSFVGYGQKNIGRLYEEFSAKERARTIHIEPAVWDMFGLHTNISGIEQIDLFDFQPCTRAVKEQFATAVNKVKDAAYETVFTCNNNGRRIRVMIRIRKEVIREVIILITGEKSGLIRILGAIRTSDIDDVIKSYGNGC